MIRWFFGREVAEVVGLLFPFFRRGSIRTLLSEQNRGQYTKNVADDQRHSQQSCARHGDGKEEDSGLHGLGIFDNPQSRCLVDKTEQIFMNCLT